MKHLPALRLLLSLVAGCIAGSNVFAGAIDTAAQAAAIVQRLTELNQQFAAYDVDLPAPTPAAGVKGKYLLPIDAEGNLTEWAKKALQAQVGNIAGEQAGAVASKGLASMVPGGGLAGGFMKKKGKETGAMLALGGSEFIKKTSSVSFDSVDAYAVYLHSKVGKSADYSKAVQAAIALYPDLEQGYAASVQAAYAGVIEEAKAKKAAADALAAQQKAEADAAAAKLAAEAAKTAAPAATTTTTATAAAPAATP